MLKLASFFLLFCWAVYPSAAQPAPPAVPAQDYEVYAALGTRSAERGRGKVFLAKPLLFVGEYTAIPQPHGFDVDFKDIRSMMFMPHPRMDSILNDPVWTAFIAAVDTSQFRLFKLEKLPALAGYETKSWTPALQKNYFGKNGSQQGFFGLRDDYKMFEGITSFSKVAYSADGQKALCYYSSVRDGENGSGSLVFLEKKAGQWQVRYSLMLWIA